jgi:hypothetical protein
MKLSFWMQTSKQVCRFYAKLSYSSFAQVQLNAWYTGLVANPSGVRSLADLIEFNNANKDLEEPPGFTSQST